MPTEQARSGASWAEEEFGAVVLADARLNRRCQMLANALCEQPTVPINQACEDWAATRAAYRFMDNPTNPPEAIWRRMCNVRWHA